MLNAAVAFAGLGKGLGMPIVRMFRIALGGVLGVALFAACSGHSGTLPVRNTVVALPTVTPAATASGSSFVLQTQTATILAASGGTVQTLDGSVTFPANVFASDTPVTLQLSSRSNITIPNAALQAVGPVLSISISAKTTSALRGRVRPRTAIPLSTVAMKFWLPAGYESIDLSHVIPEVALTALDGQVYYLAFDGRVNSDGSITIGVPANLVAQAVSIVFYLQSSAAVPLAAQPVTLQGGSWRAGLAVQPNKKTLVLVHGVLSTIDSAFPPACANSIMQQGGYEQTVGLSYDWSYAPTTIAPFIVNLLDSLGPQDRIDVEAHSYGAINVLAALPSTKATIANVILLGAPLEGSPLGGAADLENLGSSIPNGIVPATAEQLNRVSTSGLSAYVKPGSPVLAQLMARAYGGNAPGRTIKVAGNHLFDYENGLLTSLYFVDLAVINGDTPDGIDALFGGSDGIVTIGSALSAHIPTPFAETFPRNHMQLECDPGVMAYVATHLLVATPSPSPSPSPSPTASPAPSPSPSGVPATYLLVEPTSFRATEPSMGITNENLGDIIAKWAPSTYGVWIASPNPTETDGVCWDTSGLSNGNFQVFADSGAVHVNDPPYTMQQTFHTRYFANYNELAFTCSVTAYLLQGTGINILPSSPSVKITFTYAP